LLQLLEQQTQAVVAAAVVRVLVLWKMVLLAVLV
jgi:hypothetical protein